MLGAVGIGLGVYYHSHVQEAPITKRKRFIAFTNEQILESSKEALNYLLLANEGQILPAVPEAAEFYDRVLKVSQQLIKGNLDLPEDRDLEWTITVVCDRTNINAFVLSCGSIFIYTGMRGLCENDDQLGIILGHEMAHAILGHTAEVMSLRNFWDILCIIPIAALWAVLPSDLTAYIANWAASKMKTILMEHPYSRFREEEADKVGLMLAAKSCFDIREAPVVWAKIRLLDDNDGNTIGWLSTHPTHEKRQQQLDNLVQEGISLRETCQCPCLPNFDPRLKIAKYDKMTKIGFQERKNILFVPVTIDNSSEGTNTSGS